MYQSVVYHTPGLDSGQNLFILLPGIIFQLLPAVTAGSLILVLLVRARYPGRNLLSGLLIVVTATVLYSGPAYILLKLQEVPFEVRRFPIYEGKITQLKDTLLYIEKISSHENDGNTRIDTEGVSIIGLYDDKPHIRHYPTAYASIKDEALYTGDGELFSYAERPSLVESMVQPSMMLQNFVLEVRAVSQSLREAFQEGLVALLFYTSAHVLFMAGAWGVIRTSRWPLWNSLLALIFFRGLFYLDILFHSDIVYEGLKILSLQKYMYIASPAGFIVFFILFFLWGLFFLKPESIREAGI